MHDQQQTAIDRIAAGPSFARGLWRIAAADVSSGNRVTLLRDGPATFDAMIALIESAREQVLLESYIVRSDEVGERFAVAMIDAAKRGVRVRLLSDWIGMRGTSRGWIARLRAGGVEVLVFNRPGFRRWFGLVPRDHRKLLVVDDIAGITGGVGLGVEWTTGVQKKRRQRWRDTAVRISGPAALDMSKAFETMWRRGEGKERRGGYRLISRKATQTHLDPATHEPALGESLVSNGRSVLLLS